MTMMQDRSWFLAMCETLGVDPALEKAAATPNDFTDAQMDACRRFTEQYSWNMLGLTAFVEHMVVNWHDAVSMEFTNIVVHKRRCKPSEWLYSTHRLITPDRFAHTDWSQVTVAAYIETLRDVVGERWFVDRLPVRSLNSDRYVPGVVIRNVRYYEGRSYPAGVSGCGCTPEELFPLTDAEMPLAIRRLLAKRLGSRARELVCLPGAEVTYEGLLTAARVDRASLSPDAQIALAAIVEEMRVTGGGPEHADRCVGEGPDALYHGP